MLLNLFLVHHLNFKEAWSFSIEARFYLLFLLISIVFFIYYNFTIKRSLFITILSFILYSLPIKVYFLQNHIGQHFSYDEYFRKIKIFKFDTIGIGILGFLFSKFHSLLCCKYKLSLLIISIILI